MLTEPRNQISSSSALSLTPLLAAEGEFISAPH